MNVRQIDKTCTACPKQWFSKGICIPDILDWDSINEKATSNVEKKNNRDQMGTITVKVDLCCTFHLPVQVCCGPTWKVLTVSVALLRSRAPVGAVWVGIFSVLLYRLKWMSRWCKHGPMSKPTWIYKWFSSLFSINLFVCIWHKSIHNKNEHATTGTMLVYTVPWYGKWRIPTAVTLSVLILIQDAVYTTLVIGITNAAFTPTQEEPAHQP